MLEPTLHNCISAHVFLILGNKEKNSWGEERASICARQVWMFACMNMELKRTNLTNE